MVDQRVPDPNGMGDPERKRLAAAALAYMDIVPGRPIQGVPIDIACNGSCTNGRLSDLRALVDPGSTAVRREAEAERLDRVFREAGFEWRAAGCSMCVSINEDVAPPGACCIATLNRNFENCLGPGSRTYLASPAMVAAAPVSGTIADVRRVLG